MASRVELADLFEELTELLKFDEGGASFRVRAYSRAADTIRRSIIDFGKLSASKLASEDGLVKSTAADIREYYERGHITRLEELRAKHPAEFVALASIPGLAGATLFRLRDELGIHNLHDLRSALRDHQVQRLAGMGGDFRKFHDILEA